MKLSQEDFDTLQDGLDALADTYEILSEEDRKGLPERIKKAEDALVAIGTY